MNEIISRSLQILPPGEQVRKTASFSFSTAYFSVEESEQRCVDTQVRRLCSTDWLTAWCVHVIRWCLQSRGLQVEATPRMVCVWDRFIQTFDRKTSLMYKLFKTNIIRRVHEHSVQISKAPFSSMYCIWCRLFFLNKKNYKTLFLFFFQPGWLWQKKKKKKHKSDNHKINTWEINSYTAENGFTSIRTHANVQKGDGLLSPSLCGIKAL